MSHMIWLSAASHIVHLQQRKNIFSLNVKKAAGSLRAACVKQTRVWTKIGTSLFIYLLEILSWSWPIFGLWAVLDQYLHGASRPFLIFLKERLFKKVEKLFSKIARQHLSGGSSWTWMGFWHGEGNFWQILSVGELMGELKEEPRSELLCPLEPNKERHDTVCN